MPRTTVRIRVPYPDGVDAGDSVQVLTDYGSGTIDVSRPLLTLPRSVFETPSKRSTTAALSSFATLFRGKASRPGRRGAGKRSFRDLFTGRPTFDVPVDLPPVVGKWKFAARIADLAGNVQTATLVEREAFISATDPPSIRSFSFASFDPVTSKATFLVARNTE